MVWRSLGLALGLVGLAFGSWAQSVEVRSLDEPPEAKIYAAALSAMQADNLPQAIALLNLLISTSPKHAGAWLDLAEIYCRSGRETEARATLSRLKSELPSISEKIEALSPVVLSACAPSPSPSPKVIFKSFLEAGGGSNSNVNLGATQRELIVGPIENPLLLALSDSSKPQADSFLDYKGGIALNFGSSNRVLATLAAREYSSQTQFNELITDLDWQHQLTSGPWLTVLSAGYKLAMLDNKIFSQSPRISSDFYTPVSALGGRIFVGLGLSPTSYAEASAFNVFSRLSKVGILWPSGAQIEAVWLQNAATNNRPGGDAEGYQIKGRYEWTLALGWRAGLNGQAQEMQDKSIFFPGLFDLTRKQQSWSLIARVEHDLAPSWIMGVDFSNFSQIDSIPLLSFKGQELRLWLRKHF